ncbi:hypothetical protein SFRURICE_006420, partial [Spodoptera frugiperda]
IFEKSKIPNNTLPYLGIEPETPNPAVRLSGSRACDHLTNEVRSTGLSPRSTCDNTQLESASCLRKRVFAGSDLSKSTADRPRTPIEKSKGGDCSAAQRLHGWCGGCATGSGFDSRTEQLFV